MKATQTKLCARDKVPLHQHIPLDTPLLVTIEPSGICNLKCKYCLFTLPEAKISSLGHSLQLMHDDVFERIVSDLRQFPKSVKSITFARLGEPLLNKKLPEMIGRLKEEKLCGKTLVITNAIPLTRQMSHDLVSAGLDKIKISISGLSADDYLENCGSSIDFSELRSNIEYLYNNKGSMTVQIKTLDKLLGDDFEKGKERFLSLFGDICDEIDVEHLFPMFANDINYKETYFRDSEAPVNRYGSNMNRKVCSTPFYKLSIAADGKVEYCFSRGIAAGNLSKASLFEIWNSEERKSVLINLLNGKHEGLTETCLTCGCSQDSIADEDDLDNCDDEQISKFL